MRTEMVLPIPLLLCGRVVALCSPHVVCYLSSAILHNGVACRCCCAAELLRCALLVWYDTIYEAHQYEHKCKDRLITNMIFKRSLYFKPACPLTLDRSSSSSSSER